SNVNSLDESDAVESADVGAAAMAVETATTVEYFRLKSKQTRNATGERLCAEPLDNTSGAPVLQKACNNNPLGANNRQAFFKTSTLGYRIQYALKDRNSNVDLCIHMAGGATAISDGVAAVLYQCDGTRSNQQFYASPEDAEGYISLMPEHS